jgi:hypothetical protein
MIAAWVGDKDLACEQLAIAARPPRTVTYGQLKLLPYWDHSAAIRVLNKSSPRSHQKACSRQGYTNEYRTL